MDFSDQGNAEAAAGMYSGWSGWGPPGLTVRVADRSSRDGANRGNKRPRRDDGFGGGPANGQYHPGPYAPPGMPPPQQQQGQPLPQQPPGQPPAAALQMAQGDLQAILQNAGVSVGGGQPGGAGGLAPAAPAMGAAPGYEPQQGYAQPVPGGYPPPQQQQPGAGYYQQQPVPQQPAGGYAAQPPALAAAAPTGPPRAPPRPLAREATDTLYVDGFPPDASKREVAHVFRPFTGYRSVRLQIKDSKKFPGEKMTLVFVEFHSPEQAQVAMDTLQGYRVDLDWPNSPVLGFKWAKRDSYRDGVPPHQRGGNWAPRTGGMPPGRMPPGGMPPGGMPGGMPGGQPPMQDPRRRGPM